MYQTTWFTAVELAALYKVKVPTVRLWTRKGMPHLKCGRLVRFDPQQVQAWFEARQKKDG